MQQAYIDINEVPTSVITYGRWIEESAAEEDPQDIIVCIPGNPGVTEFYIDFLHKLHERLRFPVWIVGHAGHELPLKKTAQFLPLKGNEELFGLQAQIKHKCEFIEQYVPPDARIHFIGHSIGCYIILQLLKNNVSISNRTVSNYFLFPAIEHMSATPNGKLLTRVVRYILPVLLFFAWIFSTLPKCMQLLLVKIYITYYSVTPSHSSIICKFVSHDTLSKVFHMAFQEMEEVKERDNATLLINKSKIKLYYGANDRWAPVEYCKKLKSELPEIDAEVCRQNFEHAFVLQSSKQVADMVADWMIEKKNVSKI